MQLQQRGAYRSSLPCSFAIAPRRVASGIHRLLKRSLEWLGRSDPKDRQTVNSENIATYYIHSAHQIIALGEIHLPAGSNLIHSHAAAAPNDDFDFSKDGMSRSAVAAQ